MAGAAAELWLQSEGGRLTKEQAGGQHREKSQASWPHHISVAESSVNGVQADWGKHEMDTWEGKGG